MASKVTLIPERNKVIPNRRLNKRQTTLRAFTFTRDWELRVSPIPVIHAGATQGSSSSPIPRISQGPVVIETASPHNYQIQIDEKAESSGPSFRHPSLPSSKKKSGQRRRSLIKVKTPLESTRLSNNDSVTDDPKSTSEHNDLSQVSQHVSAEENQRMVLIGELPHSAHGDADEEDSSNSRPDRKTRLRLSQQRMSVDRGDGVHSTGFERITRSRLSRHDTSEGRRVHSTANNNTRSRQSQQNSSVYDGGRSLDTVHNNRSLVQNLEKQSETILETSGSYVSENEQEVGNTENHSIMPMSPSKVKSTPSIEGSSPDRGKITAKATEINTDRREVTPDKNEVTPLDGREITSGTRRVTPERRRVTSDTREVTPDRTNEAITQLPSTLAIQSSPKSGPVSRHRGELKRKSLTTEKAGSGNGEPLPKGKVCLWTTSDQNRPVSDVNELDVVLSNIEDVCLDYRENLTEKSHRKAVSKFFLNTKKDLTDLIALRQEQKFLRSAVRKAKNDVNKKRKLLLEAQQQNARLTVDIDYLKKKQSNDTHDALKAISQFLEGLKDLHVKAIAVQDDNDDSTSTMNNVPALLMESIQMSKVNANRFQTSKRKKLQNK